MAENKEFSYKLYKHQMEFTNCLGDDKYKAILLSGGMGSGKSVSLMFAALKALSIYPGIDILIIGVTYNAIKDTILREWLSICPESMILDYNKSTLTFKIQGGSTVMFRAFQDPLRIRSITVGLIIFDELILLSNLLLQEGRKRLRQKGMPNQILAATNPSSYENFVYRVFIGQQDAEGNLLPEDKKDKRFHVIYSISHDNKSLPKEYLEDLESLKAAGDLDSYNKLVLGHWGISSSGQIYRMPIDQRNKVLSKKKEDYNKIIAGVDFGFRHPLGISIIGYQDEKISVIDELYRYNMVSSDIIKVCLELQKQYNIEIFYCDSARPEVIKDMQDSGLNAVPAYKGPGSVNEGIDYVKSLIKDKLLYISTNCPNTLKEIEVYSWHVDSSNRTGDRTKEKPIKASDDLLDSIRYAIVTDHIDNRSKFEFASVPVR